jgi:transposase
MAKPYAQDLRERVVAAVDDGHTHVEVAAMFRIGIATVERYLARWRQKGTLKPDKFGGHRQHKLAEYEATVRALVLAAPDQTLAELRIELARSGIEVSKSALDRFLRTLDFTYKKNTGRQRATAGRRGRRPRRLA